MPAQRVRRACKVQLRLNGSPDTTHLTPFMSSISAACGFYYYMPFFLRLQGENRAYRRASPRSDWAHYGDRKSVV